MNGQSVEGHGAPSADELRRTFDSVTPYTIGLEDEVMLTDPATLELAPRAQEVLRLLDDPRFKLELPVAQIEIVTEPTPTVGAAVNALGRARALLTNRTDGLVVPIAAGVHPSSSGTGELNHLPRYEPTIELYGAVARRQLVAALQVHVAVGSARRALAVYNAARSYLPLLAALAANAPYYEGIDTGLASVRPKLCELLPRQGVPPPIGGWDEHAETFRWGAESGGVSAQTWWWELRPHPRHGTLEFRVPDAQSSLDQVGAIAAVIQALVMWLGERHDAGETLPVPASWRIEENRWSACRAGVEGTMADLSTGATRPTRVCLGQLLDSIAPCAAALGSTGELAAARSLVEVNGAIAQRRAGRRGGARAATAWLAERFVPAGRPAGAQRDAASVGG